MRTTRLPELPKAAAYATQIKEGRVLFEPRASFNVRGHVPLFTADQLNAYGIAVWKAAMEEAAKECERYEGEQWQKYKRGHGPERASDYCQGQSDGGGDCANAIRSLPPA